MLVLLLVACPPRTEGTYVAYGIDGEATVEPGTSWTGSEEYYVRDGTTNEVYCLYKWDEASTAVRNDCVDCAFAFDVEGSNGAIEDGACENQDLPDSYSRSYGYAPTVTYDYGGYTYTYDNVMMIYNTDDLAWEPFTYGAYSQGQLVWFTQATGYYY